VTAATSTDLPIDGPATSIDSPTAAGASFGCDLGSYRPRRSSPVADLLPGPAPHGAFWASADSNFARTGRTLITTLIEMAEIKRGVARISHGHPGTWPNRARKDTH